MTMMMIVMMILILQRTFNEHLFTCQYKGHHPFLFLRPAKEEIVNWEPKMFMYHDVMTDDQIQEIKTLGRPRVGPIVDLTIGFTFARIFSFKSTDCNYFVIFNFLINIL